MGETPRSLLWLIDLQAQVGLRHGASLRWLNLSRELLAAGHRVWFSVNHEGSDESASRAHFLDDLRARGWLSGFVETRYSFRKVKGRAAHGLLHPRLTAWILSAEQRAVCAAVEAMVLEHRLDAVVIGDRRFLFLVPMLKGRVPIIIDWSDSPTLYEWRETLLGLSQGRVASWPGAVKKLIQAFLHERFYGRRSDANFVVSPVDLKVLNRITGRPDLGRLLLNGVAPVAPTPAVRRVPERLVFTGTMSYPPNYEGAIWFIDRVLPLIAKVRPDVRLVVAGRNPVDRLRGRAGPRVEIVGAVADMHGELAQSALCVAPLRSGGGFRNKVVEAIASGVFVAGTGLAVEFLPRAFADALIVADSPLDLAAEILDFLDRPAHYESRLPALMRVLSDDYSWRQRSVEFLRIIDDASALAGAGNLRSGTLDCGIPPMETDA